MVEQISFLAYHRCLFCGRMEVAEEEDQDPPSPDHRCPSESIHAACVWVLALAPTP